MIISKTPFRISLFGGSTDYESFYSKYSSLLIGFTINKYCYASIRETPSIFDHLSRISYSKVEVVNRNEDIEHNGVRGVLKYLNKNNGYEISHMSDLPSQTGIGSSSSFIIGLLKCLTKDLNWSSKKLAETAIYIERKLLEEAGGIQDQIWAAYGGMNSIIIDQDGNFFVRPMPVSEEFKYEFINRSIMIYTGKTRQSYKIAESHNSKDAESYKLRILEQAREAYEIFKNEDIEGIAQCLDTSWSYKKKISKLVSTPIVDKMYNSLKEDGMIGGKLLGTGGSGFIFGILDSKTNINKIKEKYKSHYVNVAISEIGSTIINE